MALTPYSSPSLAIAGTASVAEAAAIAAAIESFRHDTAPGRNPAEGADRGPGDAWTRTAILEGVQRAGRAIQGGLPDPWTNT